MIVREVRLENVKSYGSPAEIIRLSRGVNAICGQNGAGKSTVLEAIGCAIFQHLPYKHEEFVREGETSGTITVVVESRLDQRTYEIVRKVGRGGAHYVYDPDISQQIARGEADVRRWLHQHLRLDDEVDLRALFLDSVGPPQGTLTAAFLEAPQERRSKFNRLLRVEEYEEAYRKLNALDAALEDERHAVEVAVARLEPLTEARASLEAQRDEVRDRKYDLVTQLQRCFAERAAVEHEVEALDRAERVWRDASSALTRALDRERDADERLVTAREEHDRAAAARDICERSRAGHERFVQAMDSLRSLEPDQRERDRLRQERHAAAIEAQRTESDVGRLDTEIARVDQAARDAAELKRKIPEQEAAEKRLQAARDAKSESEQLRKRGATLESQLTRARERVRQIECEVNGALALHPIADELPARRLSHQELASALAEANRAEGELKPLRETIALGQQQASRLAQQIDGIEAQIAMAAGFEAEAAVVATREAEHRQAADERAAATSYLEHARATRAQVAGGLCPFLHESCRNLRPGVTLETHFDGEVERWTGEVQRLGVHLREAECQLQRARDAQKRVAALPQLRSQLDQLLAVQEENAARLIENQQKVRTVAVLATRRTEIERATQAALQLVREAERAAQEVSRLDTLRHTRDEARRDCQAVEADLAAAQARIEALQVTVADLPAAAKALNDLNSPREKAAHLLAEVARLGPLRRQREMAVAQREEAEARVARIDRSLDPYRDLDERIETVRRERDANRADYEAYTTASVVAATLAERARALREAEQAADAVHVRAAAARRAVEESERAYDPPAHQRARERRGQLDTAIGDVQARIDEAGGEQSRIEAELEKVSQLEQELATLRGQIERIDDERQTADALRKSIRAAGPEITRQLLSRISRMASRINAEVLNQSGVELEWTTDFEIVTRRGGETRGFAQLSGGEQMAAALAVRLAILRDLSNVRVAFLDEPTAHLDQERRSNLGEQVQRLQGFDQLVVISHDDTFDGLFGHVIRIGRENGRSHVLDPS